MLWVLALAALAFVVLVLGREWAASEWGAARDASATSERASRGLGSSLPSEDQIGGGASASDAGPRGAARTGDMLPGSGPSSAQEDPGAAREGDDPGPGDEFISRYQGLSGRLSPSATPDGAHAVSPQRSHMDAPHVIGWTSGGVQALVGAELPLYAMVVDDEGERATAQRVDVSFFRHAPDDGVTLAMGAAPTGASHAWQVVYVPTREAHPASADGAPVRVQWTVRASGVYEGQEYSRSATGFFDVSDPGAHLATERAEASREGTDLVVRVPLHVTRPGAYWGYAELWAGPDGDVPIAFARRRAEFADAGEQVFVFLFGGAVIRASGADGPYVVRNMRFMQVDSIPPHEEPVADRVLTTPQWSASSFE